MEALEEERDKLVDHRKNVCLHVFGNRMNNMNNIGAAVLILRLKRKRKPKFPKVRKAKDMQSLRCAAFLFLLGRLDGAEGIALSNLRANMDMPTQPRPFNNNAAKPLNQQSLPKASGTESLQNVVAQPSKGSFFLVTLLAAA